MPVADLFAPRRRNLCCTAGQDDSLSEGRRDSPDDLRWIRMTQNEIKPLTRVSVLPNSSL